MISSLIEEITWKRVKEYIYGFTRDIFTSFRGVLTLKFMLLHLLAVLITFPLVLLGIDWQYFLFFRQLEFLQVVLFPAVIIGGLTPLFFPPLVYLYGKHKDYPELEPVAYALTQTAVVGLFWSALYKAFTGRMGPELRDYVPGMDNYSNNFNFGFLIGGVFDGWPSSHTTIAFALAITMILYRPQVKVADKLTQEDDLIAKLLLNKRIWVIYAIYVGIGISTNIHWLSDFVAGSLIGYTVGRSTSNVFENKFKSQDFGTFERDKSIVFTFGIILLTIIFSIFVPREFFGL